MILLVSVAEESINVNKPEQDRHQQTIQDNDIYDNMIINENNGEDFERSTVEVKRDDSKLRTMSGLVLSRGKSFGINIPLTNPSRTFSAIGSFVWDDFVNQSSKKCSNNPKGSNNNRLRINKSKLHHAEKMIRGAFIELYKGLGYLKTYR